MRVKCRSEDFRQLLPVFSTQREIMRILGMDIKIKITSAKINDLCRIDQAKQRKILGSHSQYLEDIILESIFRNKDRGFYVDIGANDPDEISNTRMFYERGWHGINVEPNVKLYNKLCRVRTNDINLNVGIADVCGEMLFHELDPDTLSTFSEESARENIKKYNARLVAKTAVKVVTLERVFGEYCNDRVIDFMSIDSEGLESQILRSNDWQSYRPVAIVIELNLDSNGDVIRFLTEKDYSLIYYNGTNGIFVDTTASQIADRSL
jgi:FkbM family methyltransferase